jgi:D-alanyl-lipoteichoic acid acyltransferase DltB (MBOAT superfamily)
VADHSGRIRITPFQLITYGEFSPFSALAADFGRLFLYITGRNRASCAKSGKSYVWVAWHINSIRVLLANAMFASLSAL